MEVDQQWWPVTRLARAVADAVRATDDVPHARALVGEVLSSGRVPLATLLHELTVTQHRSGSSAAVLRDLASGGIWSPPEGELVDLLALSVVLPALETNVLLRAVLDGRAVCRPDVLLWAAALAVALHSKEHHGSPDAWAATLARALDAEVLGLLELPVTPGLLATRGQDVLALVERHAAQRYPAGPPTGLWRDGTSSVPRRQQEPPTRARPGVVRRTGPR